MSARSLLRPLILVLTALALGCETQTESLVGLEDQPPLFKPGDRCNKPNPPPSCEPGGGGGGGGGSEPGDGEFDVTETSLGILAGDNQSDAFAVNDAGEAVGQSAGGGGRQPFYWSDASGMVSLGPVGVALAINNAAPVQVVGEDGAPQALLWTVSHIGGGVQIETLALDARRSQAFGLNDNGQVVGEALSKAVMWTVVGQTVTATTSLHDPNLGVYSFATDINNRQQVAGHVLDAAMVDRAFFWENGKISIIGPPGSVARGINDADPPQVAGRIRISENESRATLWTVTTDGAGNVVNVVQLDLSGGKHSFAMDVHDDGIVAGLSGSRSGKGAATVWTVSGSAVTAQRLTNGGSVAWDISSAGTARSVGSKGTGRFQFPEARLWTLNGP